MYSFEKKYQDLGYTNIAGCDEVGRGPLAGPLVVASVILKDDVLIEGLNDSKKLSHKKLLELSDKIKEHAKAYSIIFLDPKIVDDINVYQASKKGMIDAVLELPIKPDFVLSDAMPLKELGIPYESIIKGDQKSASIAAASIIAKVARDIYMIEIAQTYPNYGFEKHKGYPTKQHLEALELFGVLPIHRKTYKPVSDKINEQMKLKI